MSGSFGGNTEKAYSDPYSNPTYSYSSGYAKFGTDFYTYVNNNAAMAALKAQEASNAARIIASNQESMSKLMQNALGIFIIAVGAFLVCFFGIKFAKRNDEPYVIVSGNNDVYNNPAPSSEGQPVVDDLPEL